MLSTPNPLRFLLGGPRQAEQQRGMQFNSPGQHFNSQDLGDSPLVPEIGLGVVI